MWEQEKKVSPVLVSLHSQISWLLFLLSSFFFLLSSSSSLFSFDVSLHSPARAPSLRFPSLISYTFHLLVLQPWWLFLLLHIQFLAAADLQVQEKQIARKTWIEIYNIGAFILIAHRDISMIFLPYFLSHVRGNCIKWQKNLDKNNSLHIFFVYCEYVKYQVNSNIRRLSKIAIRILLEDYQLSSLLLLQLKKCNDIRQGRKFISSNFTEEK